MTPSAPDPAGVPHGRGVGVVEKWYARRRDGPPVFELTRSFPEWRAALAYPYQEFRFTSSTEEQIAARFFAMGWISGCTGTSSTMRVAAHSVRFTHTSSCAITCICSSLPPRPEALRR